jgi:hypothetical protein
MYETDIYVKTSAGAEEVKARTRKLPPRLRTLLILVDGTLNVARLKAAATVFGAPEDGLALLEQQGLIESRSASPAAVAQPVSHVDVPVDEVPTLNAADPVRFRAVQKFMNDGAVDALGLRAFFFTLKLEKCFTLDDLRALLPEFAKVVAKGAGEDAARVMSTRAQELLR